MQNNNNNQNNPGLGPNNGPVLQHSDNEVWSAPQMQQQQQQQQQWNAPAAPNRQPTGNQAQADPGMVEVEMSDVRRVFHLPCEEAAVALGVAHSRLKRACRRLGVLRWPQRKLASLSFLQDAVEKDVRMNQDDQRMVLKKIKFEYDAVVVDPNRAIDPELEALRLNLWKLKHYIKRKAAKQGGDFDPNQPGPNQHGHQHNNNNNNNDGMGGGGQMNRGFQDRNNNDGEGGMDGHMMQGHGQGGGFGNEQHSPRKRPALGGNRPDAGYEGGGGWGSRGGGGGGGGGQGGNRGPGRDDDAMGGGGDDSDGDQQMRGQRGGDRRPQQFDRRVSGDFGGNGGGRGSNGGLDAGGNPKPGGMGFNGQGDGGQRSGGPNNNMGGWGGPGAAGGWRPVKEQQGGRPNQMGPQQQQSNNLQMNRLANGPFSPGNNTNNHNQQQGPNFPAGQGPQGPRHFGGGDGGSQFPDNQQPQQQLQGNAP
ncbi:MAG: hypothetical protein WDW36_001487 [Sanguina aurantia]